MTKRHRDFGSPVLPEKMDPVTFDLYGETFNCYKQINGVSLLRFVQEANNEDGAKATEALLDMFKRIMPSKEYERFMALCDDPDTVVPVDTLSDIIGFVIEVYTDRPTKESEDS